MNTVILPRSALRSKTDNCIEKYLSLSDGQVLSVGLYVKGKKYILDFGNDESGLFYDIGSVSKTLTAHLVLKIFAEQGLDIKRPVSDFIKLRKGQYPTVYELLTHTAGYHHLTPIEITLPKLIHHRYSHRNPYENVKKEDVVKALERRNCHQSGHSYGYSDFPYAVLAVALENIKSKPFHILLAEFVNDTLGLKNTTLTRKAELPRAVHNGKTIPHWQWKNENPYIASGGLVSNIDDMLGYIELQITSGEKFITDARQICKASFKTNKKEGMCIGWHTYKKSNQLWHVGGVGTFRSSLIVNKKSQIGVAVLGNTKGIRSANIHYIAKMLYSEIKTHRIKLDKPQI